nr:MAG TPA: hypothetical protein [Bacteriophage sp.]
MPDTLSLNIGCGWKRFEPFHSVHKSEKNGSL